MSGALPFMSDISPLDQLSLPQTSLHGATQGSAADDVDFSILRWDGGVLGGFVLDGVDNVHSDIDGLLDLPMPPEVVLYDTPDLTAPDPGPPDTHQRHNEYVTNPIDKTLLLPIRTIYRWLVGGAIISAKLLWIDGLSGVTIHRRCQQAPEAVVSHSRSRQGLRVDDLLQVPIWVEEKGSGGVPVCVCYTWVDANSTFESFQRNVDEQYRYVGFVMLHLQSCDTNNIRRPTRVQIIDREGVNRVIAIAQTYCGKLFPSLCRSYMEFAKVKGEAWSRWLYLRAPAHCVYAEPTVSTLADLKKKVYSDIVCDSSSHFSNFDFGDTATCMLNSRPAYQGAEAAYKAATVLQSHRTKKPKGCDRSVVKRMHDMLEVPVPIEAIRRWPDERVSFAEYLWTITRFHDFHLVTPYRRPAASGRLRCSIHSDQASGGDILYAIDHVSCLKPWHTLASMLQHRAEGDLVLVTTMSVERVTANDTQMCLAAAAAPLHWGVCTFACVLDVDAALSTFYAP